jgi:hypothetical protein
MRDDSANWIREVAFGEINRLKQDNARLAAALDRLLHETMYKDHPGASQMAIDALKASELSESDGAS